MRDQFLEFLITDLMRNRVADLFKPGKIPEIRKVTALLRLHGLDRAIVALEENTFTIGLVLQNEALTIRSQLEKFLNQVELAQAFEYGQPGDLVIRQSHLSWPAAAGSATLTFMEDRHHGNLLVLSGAAKQPCVRIIFELKKSDPAAVFGNARHLRL